MLGGFFCFGQKFNQFGRLSRWNLKNENTMIYNTTFYLYGFGSNSLLLKIGAKFDIPLISNCTT